MKLHVSKQCRRDAAAKQKRPGSWNLPFVWLMARFVQQMEPVVEVVDQGKGIRYVVTF